MSASKRVSRPNPRGCLHQQQRFDITSGVLRRCWKFDGSDRLPEPTAVAEILPLVNFGGGDLCANRALARRHGRDAEAFLDGQGLRYWALR